jgi:hypothetical protein
MNKNWLGSTRSGYSIDYDDGSSQYNATSNFLVYGAFKVRVLYLYCTHTLYCAHTLLCSYSTVLILYCAHTLLNPNPTALILYRAHTLLCSYSTVLIPYCAHTLLCAYSTVLTIFTGPGRHKSLTQLQPDLWQACRYSPYTVHCTHHSPFTMHYTHHAPSLYNEGGGVVVWWRRGGWVSGERMIGWGGEG